jgi:hypothetical protein
MILCGKECEVTKFEDGVLIQWEKPLEKVFNTYPNFNHSNTVMIFHKTYRLGRNSDGNLIFSIALYESRVRQGNPKRLSMASTTRIVQMQGH